MSKKIGIKDIILFSIAGLIDFFEEIHDPGNLFSNYYYNYYGFVLDNWKKQNLLNNLSRCYKNNLIFKNENKKNFEITDFGKKRLYSKFPHLFWNKDNWQGKWYFVLFDFKETNRKKRDIFRHLLKYSGFILIQKSVWVSPSLKSHQIVDSWIKKEKIFEKILLIETATLPFKYEKNLVNKIWHLEQIKKNLQSIYEKLIFIKQRIKNKEHKHIKQFESEFRNIYSELVRCSLTLPRLSKKFYPKRWKYREIWSLANKMKRFFLNK
jgi:DNA-binding transcriptional regulator PaaX